MTGQGIAVSLAGPDEYDFAAALAGVKWLHVTGITPAISEAACRANLNLVERAKAAGVTVSCDLNFRKKLWNWRPGTPPKTLARQCMAEVLPHVDLVIANEEDAADVLDIHAAATDIAAGKIDASAYAGVAQQIVARFPNVTRVAITLRKASRRITTIGGAALRCRLATGAFCPAGRDGAYQPYEIRDIVDRVGAGDLFAAGLLFALNSEKHQSRARRSLSATAASCLKHSILGDFNYVTREEVEALLAGNATGRVQR